MALITAEAMRLEQKEEATRKEEKIEEYLQEKLKKETLTGSSYITYVGTAIECKIAKDLAEKAGYEVQYQSDQRDGDSVVIRWRSKG